MVVHAFTERLAAHGIPPLQRTQPHTLQFNLGKRCNQACRHCHVDASPARTESASVAVVERVLALIKASPCIQTLDITGGAPELHPHFRHLVAKARSAGLQVIDRCNLTILSEPDQADTAQFLAQHDVEVIASLPCYGEKNVDAQRGTGVFEASIAGLRSLNALGYAAPDSGLRLNLVYNPTGPALPPQQAGLEDDYRQRLLADFGVTFNALYTITNMPIARFERNLRQSRQLAGYLNLLTEHFNPEALPHLMCKSMVSVNWKGALFDCDFNQMLNLETGAEGKTIWDIDNLDRLNRAPISTGPHCLGCTAGAGSSCGGALQ
jgi:radical SAM/Cys-rich protein